VCRKRWKLCLEREGAERRRKRGERLEDAGDSIEKRLDPEMSSPSISALKVNPRDLNLTGAKILGGTM
jgi:hypothetical protein